MKNAKSLRSTLTGGLLAGVALAAGWAPSTVAAQNMDARWLPWFV